MIALTATSGTGMLVIIKAWGDMPEYVEVASTTTILGIKEEYEKALGIKTSRHELYGKHVVPSLDGVRIGALVPGAGMLLQWGQLDDHLTLADYSMPSGVKLTSRHKIVDMHIYVEDLPERTLRLGVDSEGRVLDAMINLEMAIGICRSQLELSLGNKSLDKYRSLADYDIQEGSTVHLDSNPSDSEDAEEDEDDDEEDKVDEDDADEK